MNTCRKMGRGVGSAIGAQPGVAVPRARLGLEWLAVKTGAANREGEMGRRRFGLARAIVTMAAVTATASLLFASAPGKIHLRGFALNCADSLGMTTG